MQPAQTIVIVAAFMVAAAPLALGAPLLNEFHYDNTGTDVGEFLEVVLTGATDAADVTVTLYNGSVATQYASYNVGGSFAAHGTLADGNRYYSLSLPTNGLQNGSPDGIAVDLAGTVAEFWSYEGTFMAAGGPADGLASTDVGVGESSGTPVGSSIQRIALGSVWVRTEGSSTQGSINVPEPATLALLAIGGLTLFRRRR